MYEDIYEARVCSGYVYNVGLQIVIVLPWITHRNPPGVDHANQPLKGRSHEDIFVVWITRINGSADNGNEFMGRAPFTL